MRAIVLAGGKGTRLLPYTTLLPKPLMPIGGKHSILEIIIIQLAKAGCSHITLAVNHLANLIMSYFGDGSRFNVKIDYSIEDKELGTIGPLALIKDLPENFLIMNGDILCDLNYKKFLKGHIIKKNKISVASFQRSVKIDFGVLEFDKERFLTHFSEKPLLHFHVSMGIYCLNKSVLDLIPRKSAYGFDNLMLDSLKKGYQVKIQPFTGYWLDIGRPEDYENANSNYDVISRRLGLNQ